MEITVELNPDIRGGFHVEYDGHDEFYGDLSTARSRQAAVVEKLKAEGAAVRLRPMWYQDENA